MHKKNVWATPMVLFIAFFLSVMAIQGVNAQSWYVDTLQVEAPFSLELEPQSVRINGNNLEIDGRFHIDANESPPVGNKYLGFSFNALLTNGYIRYRDYNSNDQFVQIDHGEFAYLANKLDHSHVYYTTFANIPAGTDKEFTLSFDYASRPTEFIVYFGTGSTVLSIGTNPTYIFVNTSRFDWQTRHDRISRGFEFVTYGSTWAWIFTNRANIGMHNVNSGLDRDDPPGNATNHTTDHVYYSEAYSAINGGNINLTIIEGHHYVMAQHLSGLYDNAINYQLRHNYSISDNDHYASGLDYEDDLLVSSWVTRTYPDGLCYYEDSGADEAFCIYHNSSQYPDSGLNIITHYHDNGNEYNYFYLGRNDGTATNYFNTDEEAFNCYGVEKCGGNQSDCFRVNWEYLIQTPEPNITADNDTVLWNICKAVRVNDTDSNQIINYTILPPANAPMTLLHEFYHNMTNVTTTLNGTNCKHLWNGTEYILEGTCIYDDNITVTRYSGISGNGIIENLTSVRINFMYETGDAKEMYIGLDIPGFVPPLPPAPPLNISITPSVIYCSDNYTLYQRIYMQITTNNVTNVTVTEYYTHCSNGCSNNTLLGLGNPGCIETDMMQYLLLLIIIIMLVSFIGWMVKK